MMQLMNYIQGNVPAGYEAINIKRRHVIFIISLKSSLKTKKRVQRQRTSQSSHRVAMYSMRQTLKSTKISSSKWIRLVQ